MNIEQRIINRNFDSKTNKLLSQFVEEQGSNKAWRRKRNRKSRLDKLLPEVLTKRTAGWSFERIAIFCRLKYGLANINRSTVMRRIQKFYDTNHV